MASSATLTAVPIATTNNNSSARVTSKRKSEKDITSAITKKSTERLISSISTFRIPKIARSTNSIPSPDYNEMRMETNDNTLSPVPSSKINSSPTHQLNDEMSSKAGKRKFSLNQYKEHKRLKTNDVVQNSLADVDMRINIKNSPPTAVNDDSLTISDNHQPVVSPKSDDINKDVFKKSNLSEPGVKKLIKKKLIWADEKSHALVQTSFFEIDDSEVTDMHAFARQCATNMSIAQVEKLMERDFRKQQGLQDINSLDNNDRQNLLPLPTLIRILVPDTIPIPIVKSQERLAQEEREKTILQALFIRSFLSDSPGEPDGDLLGNSTIERNEPKLIPFDDATSSSASNQVSSLNNNDSTPTNESVPPTNPTSTITPNLSSLSLDNISPEVAQILAQAKENLTSATTNNLSSTILNTQINPSIPNLTKPSTFPPTLLDILRSNGTETINVPPTNFPLNFISTPPAHFTINQLLANILSLGLPPPSATSNNSLFQQLSTTFNMPPPSMIATAINSNNNLDIKPPAVHSVSARSQQSSRFNNNNNNEHQIRTFRENNRGYNHRRGLHTHNNNNNRRDYYQNRNNNNNQNRNVFS